MSFFDTIFDILGESESAANSGEMKDFSKDIFKSTAGSNSRDGVGNYEWSTTTKETDRGTYLVIEFESDAEFEQRSEPTFLNGLRDFIVSEKISSQESKDQIAKEEAEAQAKAEGHVPPRSQARYDYEAEAAIEFEREVDLDSGVDFERVRRHKEEVEKKTFFSNGDGEDSNLWLDMLIVGALFLFSLI